MGSLVPGAATQALPQRRAGMPTREPASKPAARAHRGEGEAAVGAARCSWLRGRVLGHRLQAGHFQVPDLQGSRAGEAGKDGGAVGRPGHIHHILRGRLEREQRSLLHAHGRLSARGGVLLHVWCWAAGRQAWRPQLQWEQSLAKQTLLVQPRSVALTC